MTYLEGANRGQVGMLPVCVEDYVGADAFFRVVDAFVDSFDLSDFPEAPTPE